MLTEVNMNLQLYIMYVTLSCGMLFMTTYGLDEHMHFLFSYDNVLHSEVSMKCGTHVYYNMRLKHSECSTPSSPDLHFIYCEPILISYPV